MKTTIVETSIAASLLLLGGLALMPLVFSSQGCMPKEGPFQSKSTTRPAEVYCFDVVGHTPGTKPYVFGGTCCCTPTDQLMAQYHADGHQQDMTLDDLLQEYERRGIKTALDHKGCNNLCKWGPHVVKGGKCMVSPTPGTKNFEHIRFAIRYVPAVTEKKK